jgi:acyl-CoA synthetase (AMP-forming)/AMP-acid ligase II
VISGGLNVYPAEIEKALHGIDGLVDLAVIGVVDDRWGEVPMVVFHSDRAAADVVADITDVAGRNLSKYKWPRHALALDEPLPRTFSGKLAKAVLRERFPMAPTAAVPVVRASAVTAAD